MIDQKLCFRPSITLFVHEVGEQVYQQFLAVLNLVRIPALLPTCIGLMTVQVDASTGTVNATPHAPGTTFPAGMPEQPDTLEALIMPMVRHVQGVNSLRLLEDNGYEVPLDLQINIVGSVQDSYIGSVLKIVRRQLRLHNFETTICYLLDCVASPTVGGAASPSSMATPVLDWSQREIADLCFVFDDRITFPNVKFADEVLRSYTMAEALFALVATGITLDGTLRNIMTYLPGASYDKVGTIRTSAVAFPRVTVEHYCSGEFGAELMDQWLHRIQQAHFKIEEGEEERKQAERAVEEIKADLMEYTLRENAHPGPAPALPEREEESKVDKPLPLDVHLAPSLEILLKKAPYLDDFELQEQRRLYDRVMKDTEHLFGLFLYKAVTEDKQQYQHRNWSDIADDRVGKAAALYQTWQQRAEEAWQQIESRLERQWRGEINGKWPKGDNGIVLTRIYVDELGAQLDDLLDTFAQLREKHESRYKNAIGMYREKVQEWLIQPGQANLLGSAQGPAAIPQAPGVASQFAPTPPSALPAMNQSLQQTTGGGLQAHLDANEEEIIRALKQWVNYEESRVPGPTGALTALLLTFGCIGLPLLSLFPQGLFAVLSACLAALLGVGGYYSLLMYRRKRERKAKLDMLKFFCLCYAYRCEVFEDDMRTSVLPPLRRLVQKWLHRLEKMESFIDAVRDMLHNAATEAHNELFAGPAEKLDLFIANSNQLRSNQATLREQRDTITLNDVTDMLRRMRENSLEGGVGWHASPVAILERFFASLKQGKSPLEMSEEEMRDHTRQFALNGLVSMYLDGAFVDIAHALNERKLQQKVFQHMQSPFYQLQGIMHPLRKFIGGKTPLSDDRHNPGQLADATFARTDDAEWYLFASFFYGNTPLTLDADILFPPRVP